jgi:Ni,Fe-hydrogenase III small subunit
MIGWLFTGLRSRRLTGGYPAREEAAPAGYRGRAVLAGPAARERAQALASICLPGALSVTESGALRLEGTRCIGCGLCAGALGGEAVELESRYELAARVPGGLAAESSAGSPPGAPRAAPAREEPAPHEGRRLPAPFRRSIHIRHLDAGSDGAVEQEIAALLNPYYDMHRLGLFFTATPRHADVLLVTGPVTAPMEEHLRRTYEAMPEPRIVVAAGTDACSGGIWAGPEVGGGVDSVLPVDVYIPGDPPAPITLLPGLRLATGRVAPAPPPARVEEGR